MYRLYDRPANDYKWDYPFPYSAQVVYQKVLIVAAVAGITVLLSQQTSLAFAFFVPGCLALLHGLSYPCSVSTCPRCPCFLFLAVVLDAFSRRIVGWAMATHLRMSLVLSALDMALFQRKPGDVTHHSDQGTQYTSLAFGQRCREVMKSMSSDAGRPGCDRRWVRSGTVTTMRCARASSRRSSAS